MTAQIPDHFTLDGTSYALVDGIGLFSPLEYGLEPIMTVTSCWRGYICTYAIHEQQLVLDTLDISLRNFLQPESQMADAPRLNGVRALRKRSILAHSFVGLALPIPYTGRLQIADDFIRELYVHMGFHPAWKYRKVIELSFEAGSLTGNRDISTEMQQVREKLTGKSFK